MSAPGWRLTFEPCGPMVAWSLIRVDDDHPQGEVWAGILRDTTHLRALAEEAADPAGDLVDPGREPIVARELGVGLLPGALRQELSRSTEVQTLCVLARGWLASVPWDSLAVDWGGTRVIERCIVIGGLAPGLAADVGAVTPTPEARGTRWVIDPGPPDGAWPPLFPAGYPAQVRALPAAGDDLVPDGLPLGPDVLSHDLTTRPRGQLGFLGHVTSDPASPAAAALVLSDANGEALFTAHQWLREPGRWPAPVRVALIGCGSDDGRSFEQAGLPIAALLAGARLVTTTRWPLPNSPAAVHLLRGVCAAQRLAGVHALRRWQLGCLTRWRQEGTADDSPLYWASLVTYDRELITGGMS